MNRLEKLTEFLKDTPNDPFLKYAIATEWNTEGNREEALKWFEEIERHHPEYVATYYHLGKLRNALGDEEKALATYKTGMVYAKMEGNQHAFAELQTAHTNLEMGLDDD